MKKDRTIYIKCDRQRLFNNTQYAVVIACTVVSGLLFALSFYGIVTMPSAYLALAVCSLVAALTVYFASKEPPHHYICLNNDEISFKQNKLEEEVCLKFDCVDYFETRFSEIVFSTKQQEKIVLPLNSIANKQKRWEIKEFLREHVKQVKSNALVA